MVEKETIVLEDSSESGLRETMRGILRWLLVALAAFEVGVLLITFAFYVPTRKKLNKANADLELANALITNKIDQITTL